ncbi:MAG: type II secretion system protein [Parcubacteria group bacterium]|nr:type II secretion system protein [Parcubacteria group bacterium]
MNLNFKKNSKKPKSYPSTTAKLATGHGKLQAHRGFTLIEMIVAVSVFTVVMVSSIGALLSIIDANRKAQSLRIVMDNLNFALENITRNMRVGVDYHCGAVGDLNTTRDCPIDGDTLIAFTDSSGDRVIFRLNNGRIEKSEDLGISFLGITSPEIVIEDLRFFVQGSEEGDGLQPKVLVIVKGTAGTTQKSSTTFSLQTLASQRLRDFSASAPPPPPPPPPPTSLSLQLSVSSSVGGPSGDGDARLEVIFDGGGTTYVVDKAIDPQIDFLTANKEFDISSIPDTMSVHYTATVISDDHQITYFGINVLETVSGTEYATEYSCAGMSYQTDSRRRTLAGSEPGLGANYNRGWAFGGFTVDESYECTRNP